MRRAAFLQGVFLLLNFLDPHSWWKTAAGMLPTGIGSVGLIVLLGVAWVGARELETKGYYTRAVAGGFALVVSSVASSFYAIETLAMVYDFASGDSPQPRSLVPLVAACAASVSGVVASLKAGAVLHDPAVRAAFHD
jgi:hypothetical protein